MRYTYPVYQFFYFLSILLIFNILILQIIIFYYKLNLWLKMKN